MATQDFDELAKGLASGNISRGKALRLLGAALLGGTLASIPGLAQADPIKGPICAVGVHCSTAQKCCVGSTSFVCCGGINPPVCCLIKDGKTTVSQCVNTRDECKALDGRVVRGRN